MNQDNQDNQVSQTTELQGQVLAPQTSPIEEQNIEVLEPRITFDDFLKVQMKAGKVINAEILEKSEKLLRLTVDFGETDPRQVISGIRHAFSDPATLIGNTYVFVTNLEPRKILGLESQAMIIAAKDDQGMVLFTPTGNITPGTLLG
jgi:methionyl-tRNA synthetase